MSEGARRMSNGQGSLVDGETDRQPSAINHQPSDRAAAWTGPLKAAGPVIAWIAALACAWRAAGPLWGSAVTEAPGDLLDAALRGGAAWLGVLVIWTAGVTACERCLAAWRAARDEERS